MWRGTHVHRFRAFTVHIEANPVFAHFNVSTGFTQLRQYGIQRIRLRITADDFATRNRRRHQEGAGFDTVWQHAIHTATQTFYAFDGNTVGALPRDFRPHRVKEVRRIDDFRLTRGVFNDGGAFSQGRGSHDGHGRANADHIHHDVRAFQAAVDGCFDVAFFQLNFCTELLKAGNVQINGTRADGTTTRQRNLTLAKTCNQRPQGPDRGTHGFHQVVWRTEYVYRACVNPYRTITLNLRTQLSQQLHGGIDVFQLGYVLNLNRLFCQQSGKKNRQGSILSTANGDLTFQAGRPLHTKFIHQI